MKRITTLLRESEAMAVRNAVCIAGGKSVVITPVLQHQCSNDTWQWRGDQSSAQNEMHVRFEVTADDSHHRGIVSAINRTSHSGRIIVVFNHNRPLKHAAYNHKQSLFFELGEAGYAGIYP
ncbi:MAG: hypothetical protein WC216_12120 [Gallionella sp.]|jgi:nitrogen regulatory protein PII